MLVPGNLGSSPAADRTGAGPRTSPLPNSVWSGALGPLLLPLTIRGEAKVTVHWGGGKRGRGRGGGIGRNARWRIHRFRSRVGEQLPEYPKKIGPATEEQKQRSLKPESENQEMDWETGAYCMG